ncbi:unnamed protein product [Ectocarpus sp. 13 AM-2016]
MRREIFDTKLAILSNVLAEIRPPPGSSVTAWTGGGTLTKVAWVVASVVYLVVAFAYATSFNVTTAPAVYMAVSSWIIVAVSLRLAASTTAATARDIGAGSSPRERYRASALLVQRANRRAPNRGVAMPASGAVNRDHAYWCKWTDNLWHKCKSMDDWTEDDFRKDMEKSEDVRNEARDQFETKQTHEDWLRLVDRWQPNVDDKETWWDEKHLEKEMTRTKELRDAALEQHETEESEEEAVSDGGEWACSRCGELGGYADDLWFCDGCSPDEEDGSGGTDSGDAGWTDGMNEEGGGGAGGVNGYSTDEEDGNDIGDPESNNQEIAGKKSRKRDKKHSVLVDLGGDDSVEQRLQKEYQQAMDMKEEMKGCTAKLETRNLTLNDVKSALLELDQESTDGPCLQMAFQNLEKSGYRLYGIKVRCRGRKGKKNEEKGTMIRRGGRQEKWWTSKSTKIQA